MGNPKAIGALSGLILGGVLLWEGPLKAFLLALFVLAGWLIGKYLNGEIDIVELHERFMTSRNRRPRL